MAYFQAVAMDEASYKGVVTAALVFHALGGVTVVDLADVPQPASVRS
jgi:hypothetical protein